MLIRIKPLLMASFLGSAILAQAATYNGDLIVGFTALSGNDLIYDLGPASSLTNGQSWNLSSLLTGFNLTTVNWGVIGDKSGTPRVAWTTTGGALPPTLAGNTAWSALDTPTRSIYGNFATVGTGNYLAIAATDDNSWNQQAINGPLATQYHNAYEDPTVVGQAPASFFQVLANGSAPTQLGAFTLSTGGVLTFNVVFATPPPPPRPVLSITRSGNTSTISFGTTNGAIYTLYFTNTTGLTAPLANWPSSPTTVMGNGGTNSFTDITTDSIRFYGVLAH